MRIVVSAEGEGPDAPVDPRFGRCSHLTVVDIDTMEFRTVPNSGAMASGGAGIRTSQEVAAMGVDAVVTGSVGPNAFETLSRAGIRVLTGARGTVREAVEMFRRGQLEEATTPNAGGHAGLGRGMGLGRRGGR